VTEQTGDLRVDAALSILNERFTDPALSLTTLSDALGVCEDHFGRLFKKEVKSPFRHYLRQLRIEQAKYLLLNSNDGVKTIAAAVGYSSHSYFTHDFHAHMGISPREFREAGKNHRTRELPTHAIASQKSDL
jgi:two-component system, response regulator YesN